MNKLHPFFTLATLRDTLLWKLLSGELSVTTASEQLEKMRPSERG
jgi:hypothetical protein